MPNRIHAQKARLSVTAALLGATALTSLPSASVAEIVYGEMVDLTFGSEWVVGDSAANAVSNGGLVVFGGAYDLSVRRIFRWTEETGMENLADFNGDGTISGLGNEWATADTRYVYYMRTNSDGSILAGTASDGDQLRGYIWAGETGMVKLADFNGDGTISGTGLEWNNGTAFIEGISDDGSVVTGWGYNTLTSRAQAFRWTAETGMVILADFNGDGTISGTGAEWATFQGTPADISGDGSVVVGSAKGSAEGPYSNRDQSFRWTAETGMMNLADFNGDGTISGTGAEWATNYSGANAVSADGSVVVGLGNDSSNISSAYRWTSDLGMVNITEGASWATDYGGASSGATQVSADGFVIAGYAKIGPGDTDYRTFRWTEETGMVNIQEDNDWITGDSWSDAISADGTVIIGSALQGEIYRAYRWTEDTGMVNIADHDGSGIVGDSKGEWATKDGWVSALSPDGSALVGEVSDANDVYRAFIYRSETSSGMLDAENTVSAIADNVVAQGTAIAALGAGLSFAAETELAAGAGAQPSTASISSKSYSDSLPMAIRLGASASSNADTGSLSFGSASGAIGLSEEMTVGGFASLGTEASSLGGLGFDGTITSFGAFVRSTPLGGSGLTWKAALATSGGAVTISRDDSLVGTEAASGSSRLSSTSANFELGYRLPAQNRITTPFLRLAQTSTTRAAYDEDASYDFPISYDAVTELVTTATLGVDSRLAINESNTLRLTAGLEKDLSRSNSPITGTSDIPNLTSFSIDAADIAAVRNPTRGYLGLGLTHDFGNGATINFDLRADQNAFTATPTYSGGIAYQMKF